MRLLLAAALLPSLVLAPAAADQRDPRLSELFDRLAEGDADAQSAIEEAWYAPPEAGIAVLFSRAVEALNADDPDLALLLAGHVNGLAPSFAEGWVLTGHARSAAGDNAGAGRAYAEAVALEPRHFVALARLGDLAVEAGDKAAGLRRYRQVLRIHPNMTAVRERAERLRDETSAQEI